MAEPLRSDHRERRCDSVQHPAEIHVEYPVPIGERAVGERGDRSHSGVGHKRIKAPEPLDCVRDAYFSLVVLYWYLRKD